MSSSWKSQYLWFSEPELHLLVNDPKCYIPVKTARPRILERKLVVNERGREILGHCQIMAIFIGNSFTGSSNTCSVTNKQPKASCLGRGCEWSVGTPGSLGTRLLSATAGPARGEKPQSQPTCVFQVAIPVNVMYAVPVQHLGLSENWLWILPLP